MKIICDISVYQFYFARCMTQLVKYDVHTTRKMKSIHAIFITYYHHMCHERWALHIVIKRKVFTFIFAVFLQYFMLLLSVTLV